MHSVAVKHMTGVTQLKRNFRKLKNCEPSTWLYHHRMRMLYHLDMHSTVSEMRMEKSSGTRRDSLPKATDNVSALITLIPMCQLSILPLCVSSSHSLCENHPSSSKQMSKMHI